MRKQTINWEKIFTNHASDNRLISRAYKEFPKVKIIKKSIQLEKWAKDMKRQYIEEHKHVVNCYVKEPRMASVYWPLGCLFLHWRLRPNPNYYTSSCLRHSPTSRFLGIWSLTTFHSLKVSPHTCWPSISWSLWLYRRTLSSYGP